MDIFSVYVAVVGIVNHDSVAFAVEVIVIARHFEKLQRIVKGTLIKVVIAETAVCGDL